MKPTTTMLPCASTPTLVGNTSPIDGGKPTLRAGPGIEPPVPELLDVLEEAAGPVELDDAELLAVVVGPAPPTPLLLVVESQVHVP
jgi:hypothetical protein